MRKRICDAAVEVLRETDNPHVQSRDAHLLHTIAERANPNYKADAWDTEKRVLNALSRQPGILIPGKTMQGRRAVRIFRLPV